VAKSSGLATTNCSPISTAVSSVVRRARGLPFVAEQAHHDEVVVRARAPDVGAEATFLDEAAGAIGAGGPLVVAPDAQPDFAPVQQAKGVVGEQRDNFAAVALAPILLVAMPMPSSVV
jgi:hypothetical protein